MRVFHAVLVKDVLDKYVNIITQKDAELMKKDDEMAQFVQFALNCQIDEADIQALFQKTRNCTPERAAVILQKLKALGTEA